MPKLLLTIRLLTNNHFQDVDFKMNQLLFLKNTTIENNIPTVLDPSLTKEIVHLLMLLLVLLLLLTDYVNKQKEKLMFNWVLKAIYLVIKKAVSAKEELFLPFMIMLKKKVSLKKIALPTLEIKMLNVLQILLLAKNISLMTIVLLVLKKESKEKF